MEWSIQSNEIDRKNNKEIHNQEKYEKSEEVRKKTRMKKESKDRWQTEKERK